jgi:hypothetical protein
LARVVGEPAVRAMETGFDIVVMLVTQGPAAAWDKIRDQLAQLRDSVIGGIVDFVTNMVIQRAVPRLISMFVPGAGFIQAIMSIYDTIMVFVNRLSSIAQVVTGFIDSIVAIANGNIEAAVNRVENSLAHVMSLAINFLAGFVGLGNVAERVMGVIHRVQGLVDRGLDALINWIVTMARRLGRFVAQAGLPNDPNERAALGIQTAKDAVNKFARRPVRRAVLEPILAGIKIRYGFTILELREKGLKWSLFGVLNPTVGVDTDAEVSGIIPLNMVTPAERAKIEMIPGGNKQLQKLDKILAGGGQQAKIDAEIAVIRTVLAAIDQGKNIRYIGWELYKIGEIEALREIDVLTNDEIIEVKTGDYSEARKLSDRDFKQFTEVKRFFERKISVVDVKGGTVQIVAPPSKWIYQFTKPISPKLYSWLKAKGVTEVRTAI